MNTRAGLALLVAAVTIAARTPFLLSGRIPFDSDEAVEGLMARHVLQGEFPAFFWGQAFKGVPEVYASAAAFALFGSGVLVLKSVTLACFAVFAALQFAVVDRVVSRWVALAASGLLIAAPPSVVYWSLSGSADYVMVMLLGSLLLLLCLRIGCARTPSHGRLFAIGVVVGLGLWVHQLFLVYLGPVALLLALASPSVRRMAWARRSPVTSGLAAIAAGYALLGLVAFLTGGFAVPIGPASISVTAPQKMLRIAAGIGGLALLTHAIGNTSLMQARAIAVRHWAIAAGFCLGYLPTLLYSAFVGPARSPSRSANIFELRDAAPDITGNVLPILFGFKMATTERLPVPALAALPALVALLAYLWTTRQSLAAAVRPGPPAPVWGAFFPIFVALVPALFVFGGVYLDAQSYRYLVPWYAGLAVAWASGSLALARHRTWLATVFVLAIASVHVWQQALWFERLEPDVQSTAIIDCLKTRGIRGGFADYWTAYKLTFLSAETLIVAPSNGVDRYRPYSEFVRSLPAHERVADASRCE